MAIVTDTPAPHSILSCGCCYVGPLPLQFGGTGYARTPDGRVICYGHANEEAVAELLTVPRVFAYLSRDHKCVTTWPGGTLGRVTAYWTGGKRWSTYGYVTRCYVRVTDVHGQRWAGSGPVENGDFVRLRRVK